ncbi:MAG: hypothetical protein D6815_02925 [Candidatus Dadabacteria bacterium]|nr:MAG: hypothetical protein D6815_02925 [Candidatus Dadabacteria bacterium]
MWFPWQSVWASGKAQVESFVEAFRRESRDAGITALLMPVDPFNRSTLLTPVVAALGVTGILMLSSVAAGALMAAALALLAVYFLLTEVFGYEIDLAVPVVSPSA